ncbi:MAG TPA: flagellar biosynthetic protein FliR [Beijerinckiaceae bacterium]|nr:flagellar biosynthetic protein FliR [Beijerinckiaceae bacterium]
MPRFAGLGDGFFELATLFTMAATIGFARYYGFTFVFPLFSWMQVRGPLRFAIALGLSMPSIILVYGQLRSGGLVPTGMWAVLVAKEALVGALIGALMGLPFWAMQGMGDAIDVYRGGSAANLFDPVHAQEMTITGNFLLLLALVLFVVIGGVSQSVDIVLRSQAVWPAMHLVPPFEWEALRNLADVAARGLSIALIVAAPLLIAMLLIDVALMFAVKGARTLQIYELSQAARGLLLLMILPAFVLLFESHFVTYLRGLLEAMRSALGLLSR